MRSILGQNFESTCFLRAAGYCLSAALLLAIAMTGDTFAAPLR
jgi:hypothetical protein